MGVRRGVDNGNLREREGDVGCAGAGAGKADAGDARKGEEVRLVRVGAGTDEAGYASGDTPLIQRSCSFVLNKGDGGKDGVSDRGVKETNERISLDVGDWEREACRGKENKWIG